MELIEIAQLVTGIATLIVASVLIWQMIIQKRTLDIAHNDADSSMSFQAVDQHNENQRWFSESFSDESIEKMKIGLESLSEKGQNKIRAFVFGEFMTIHTEYRLGRRERNHDYYEYALKRYLLLQYKSSREILEEIYLANINSSAMNSELKVLIRETLDDYENKKTGV